MKYTPKRSNFNFDNRFEIRNPNKISNHEKSSCIRSTLSDSISLLRESGSDRLGSYDLLENAARLILKVNKKSFPLSFPSLSRQPNRPSKFVIFYHICEWKCIQIANFFVRKDWKLKESIFIIITSRSKKIQALFTQPSLNWKIFVWTVEWTIRVPREDWAWGVGALYRDVGGWPEPVWLGFTRFEVRESSKPAHW